jgi:hypothetical protein
VQGWVPKSPKGGDGEVTVVPDETLGEQDPLLAKLLAAATAAPRRTSSRVQPTSSHARRRQRQAGRERLCRYILRPPLAIA